MPIPTPYKVGADFTDNFNTFTAEIVQRVVETNEEFIFQTISPFCNEIAEQHITKKQLIDALKHYKDLESENEKLRAKLAHIHNIATP